MATGAGELFAFDAAGKGELKPLIEGRPLFEGGELATVVESLSQALERAGPGDDYKLLFVYRVRGLPLQVVAETSEWRRVCDPEGSLAWVHKRTTDGRRMTMNTATQPMALLKRPKDGFRAAAFLNPRTLATLDHCDKGWCKVKADHAGGWVREGALWGTSDAVQCRQGQ